MFFPIVFYRNSGGGGYSGGGLHYQALNKEYTSKFGKISSYKQSKTIGFGEVVRGTKTFLKCKISGIEIEAETCRGGV